MASLSTSPDLLPEDARRNPQQTAPTGDPPAQQSSDLASSSDSESRDMGYEYANGSGEDGDKVKLKKPHATVVEKLQYGSYLYTLQAMLAVPLWYRGWREYFNPPAGGPNIVKSYECRRHLPVRIFFPASYDQTSSKVLQTVFTIHGGGWCVGVNRDDDEYNRAFADKQDVLVVSLNYSKAPGAPYPTALYDLEALYHAVIGDESLPIARAANSPNGRSRIAVLGFSSGGNLALALSQLPSIRQSPDAPRAAVTVYGALDLSRKASDKVRNRFYKPALPPPRGNRFDSLGMVAPAFEWGYVPYGHDLTDPLLSPAYARLEDLPPHIYVIACELDMLSHESWRLACRLGNDGSRAHGIPPTREVPDPESRADKTKCPGKRASSKRKGALEEEDERFCWSETWDDGSVNWLLVPDVVHGFDNEGIRQFGGGDETIKDAEMKTAACQKKLGEWLHTVVWK